MLHSLERHLHLFVLLFLFFIHFFWLKLCIYVGHWESCWECTVVAFVTEATMFGFGKNRVWYQNLWNSALPQPAALLEPQAVVCDSGELESEALRTRKRKLEEVGTWDGLSFRIFVDLYSSIWIYMDFFVDFFVDIYIYIWILTYFDWASLGFIFQ